MCRRFDPVERVVRDEEAPGEPAHRLGAQTAPAVLLADANVEQRTSSRDVVEVRQAHDADNGVLLGDPVRIDTRTPERDSGSAIFRSGWGVEGPVVGGEEAERRVRVIATNDRSKRERHDQEHARNGNHDHVRLAGSPRHIGSGSQRPHAGIPGRRRVSCCPSNVRSL